VRGALEYDGPLRVGLLTRMRESVCAAAATGCATHWFGIGQAIYTGDTEFPSEAHRPVAAWLFVEAAERDSAAGVVQEMRLAVGVVGPPALGEPMQNLFHGLGPEYQRPPVDWQRQLPFEPGFLARITRTTTHGEFAAGPWSGGFTSHVGGALGTILTSATGGGGANAGVQLGGESAGKWWPRFEMGAELRGHVVARDEFLDGTMFRTSESVARKSFYDEEQLFIGLRWKQIALGYRATRTGLQYGGQPSPAKWSALDVEWRRD
jgi:lipid A 3-O-deacylase